MVFVGGGQVKWALVCLLFSGFCDLFDGIVARTKKNRSAEQKNFGIQLDSLCDVIAFGVLPAMIFYSCGADTEIGVAILILYVLCGLIRLAFFNVLETKRQESEEGSVKSFRGMPITFSSFLTPIFCIIGHFLLGENGTWLYYVAPAIMGFLFIVDIKIPKLDLGAILFSKK